MRLIVCNAVITERLRSPRLSPGSQHQQNNVMHIVNFESYVTMDAMLYAPRSLHK